MPRRLIERTTSLVPPILGGFYALQGLDLLISKPQLFTSRVYEVMFQVMGKPMWGVLFLTIGLWALFSRWLIACIALVALLAFWDAMLLQSVLIKHVHWGVLVSTTAAITLILVALGRGTIMPSREVTE